VTTGYSAARVACDSKVPLALFGFVEAAGDCQRGIGRVIEERFNRTAARALPSAAFTSVSADSEGRRSEGRCQSLARNNRRQRAQNPDEPCAEKMTIALRLLPEFFLSVRSCYASKRELRL
jgi:hypothetical protein